MRNATPSVIEMEQRSADEGNASRRKAYRRVSKTQPITFTCEACGEEVTEGQYPGGNPQYCGDCIREVRKQQNRERVRHYRERKRKRAV